MDVYHILLRRPWEYDRRTIYDGRRNTYTLDKDGCNYVLLPLNDEEIKDGGNPSALLMSGKELLCKIKEEKEIQISLIGKPRVVHANNTLNYLLDEIQALLDEFFDIIIDDLPNELPPMRSISCHMDLIPRVNVPNKTSYRMTAKENEEIINRVQEPLDK